MQDLLENSIFNYKCKWINLNLHVHFTHFTKLTQKVLQVRIIPQKTPEDLEDNKRGNLGDVDFTPDLEII